MTVSTHDDRASLAGSTPINAADPAQDDEHGTLVDPGADAGQDGAPKRRGGSRPRRPKPGVLVLTCERCRHAIAGTGAGYAYVSLVDAQRVAQRAAAGHHDPAKARWTLAHRQCAPVALAPMSGRFVLWLPSIAPTDALLDAMVTLSREPWFGWTDWGALARAILAETESASLRAYVRTEGDIAAYRNRVKVEDAQRRSTERDEQRRQRSETRLREAEQHRQARLQQAEQRKIERREERQRLTEQRQAEKREAQRLAAEQRRPERPQPGHGTTAKYESGCRCDRCRAAKIERVRERRRAREAKAEAFRNDPADDRHGTMNAYCHYACRCERCTVAMRQQRASAKQS